MTTRGKLDGRVAVITGIATGIGRAGAQLFAAEGAAVVGLDRNATDGLETVEAIRQAGGQATLVVGDAGSNDDVVRAVEAATAAYGKLDLIWANAGIGVFKDVVDTSLDDWHGIVGVNLTGAYLLAHHGIPHLLEAGGGTVVMTASTSAFLGSPRWAAYCATKGGLVAMARAMAIDYADRNIRVNCVCPGAIETPLLELDKRSSTLPYEDAMRREIEAHPMARVGRPEEVARAALFLSCDDSSFTTGTSLFVDGGYAAQ